MVSLCDANSVIWHQLWHQWCHMTKCHVTPCVHHLNLINAIMPLMILSATCGATTSTRSVIWAICHVAPRFSHLRNTMVPLAVPLVFSDTNADTHGVTCLQSLVAPHFDCIFLMKAVVSYMKSSESCNADAGAMATWPKSHVAPHFDYLGLMNVMVLVRMPSVSHDDIASTNGITWPNKSQCTSFQWPWCNKYDGAI